MSLPISLKTRVVSKIDVTAETKVSRNLGVLTFIFAIDKAIQNAIDAVVKLDKERYLKNNPNALASFLPERIYPDVPKLELRNEAFHKLENNVTVTKV